MAYKTQSIMFLCYEILLLGQQVRKTFGEGNPLCVSGIAMTCGDTGAPLCQVPHRALARGLCTCRPLSRGICGTATSCLWRFSQHEGHKWGALAATWGIRRPFPSTAKAAVLPTDVRPGGSVPTGSVPPCPELTPKTPRGAMKVPHTPKYFGFLMGTSSRSDWETNWPFLLLLKESAIQMMQCSAGQWL